MNFVLGCFFGEPSDIWVNLAIEQKAVIFFLANCRHVLLQQHLADLHHHLPIFVQIAMANVPFKTAPH
jgi:hypothetical protein